MPIRHGNYLNLLLKYTSPLFGYCGRINISFVVISYMVTTSIFYIYKKFVGFFSKINDDRRVLVIKEYHINPCGAGKGDKVVNILYGMEVPLMGLLILIWVFLGWISGRLCFVSELNQVQKSIKSVQILSVILLLITVCMILVVVLGLDFFFEKDKIWLHLILLVLPLLAVMFFSRPKAKRIYESIHKSSNHEISTELRVLTTDLWFVLPFQIGVYTTIINLCFFLFPYGYLTFMDYFIPCALLLVLFTVLWLRYYRRQQAISRKDNHVESNLFHRRATRTVISLVLAVISSAAFMTAAAVTTISNGTYEENQVESAHFQSGYVKTEGDELYYEVRGDGPPLLLIPGGGGDAGFYTYVANILADDYQVITYDRRGNSRSTWNDPRNFEISQQARDAVAILHATGHTSAYVVGNSSGAIIALEMAEKYPDTIKAVVAHEPPAVKVLPDREKWLTFLSSVYQTAHRYGAELANIQFLLSFGVPASTFSNTPEDFQERYSGNGEILLKNEMQPAINYRPNTEKIKANEVKVIMAAGEMSLKKESYYARTSPILAEQLNAEFVVFPGHHLSYFDMPTEWAETLNKVLQES
jgi:pimeloyl-ACP methyl ester carboxylesterase